MSSVFPINIKLQQKLDELLRSVPPEVLVRIAKNLTKHEARSHEQ